jgi:hypothetical protein
VREPSSPNARWAWWEAAVAGEEPPVYEGEPQAGFFAVRRFRYADWPTGPFVPARVWWEPGEIDPETGELLSDERCKAEIDGVSVDPWRWLRAMSPLLPTRLPSRRVPTRTRTSS